MSSTRWRYWKFKLGMYLMRDYLVGKNPYALTKSSVEIDDGGWTVTATAVRNGCAEDTHLANPIGEQWLPEER